MSSRLNLVAEVNTATQVAKQRLEEVQQFHTFGTTDEYVEKNIDSVIR